MNVSSTDARSGRFEVLRWVIALALFAVYLVVPDGDGWIAISALATLTAYLLLGYPLLRRGVAEFRKGYREP